MNRVNLQVLTESQAEVGANCTCPYWWVDRESELQVGTILSSSQRQRGSIFGGHILIEAQGIFPNASEKVGGPLFGHRAYPSTY